MGVADQTWAIVVALALPTETLPDRRRKFIGITGGRPLKETTPERGHLGRHFIGCPWARTSGSASQDT